MAKKKQELSSEELLEQALVREEDWPYQVPGNWVWSKLDKLKESESGFFDGDWILSQNMDINGEVRLIQLSDIGIGIFLDKSSKYINSEKFEELGCKEIFEGDILISRMADPIVRSFIFPKLEYKCITVVDIAVLRCNTSIVDRKFINFLCNTPWFTNLAMSISRGTTRVRITRKNLGELPIPLPPLAEQQRIVDRIESLFDQLDQAKDLIQEVLDSFETRKAAILHQAFTGELTKKWRAAHGVGLESWEETKSKSIFEYVTSGSRGWAQYYDTSGSIFIRMGNLDHGTIELDLEDIQYVNLPEMVEGKRSKVEKNDILISITADVGMVGLVRNENMEAYINQHVALARPVKSVNAEFIAWFLVSDIGLHQLQSLQRGVTKIGLTLGDIRNLTIKLPCLSEQIEIVRILVDLFAKEQNAKDLCDLIDQIEAMKKTILGKAFRGDLGTNEAGEESAMISLKSLQM